MKRNNIKKMILIVGCVLALGLCGCGKPSESSKTGANLAQTEYAYSIATGEGLTLTIEFNDAEFIKLALSGTEVASENYLLAESVLSLKKSYLSSLGDGDYSFAIVTDLGDLSFTVTISSFKKVDISDLIDDSYYKVHLGSGSGLVELPDEESVDRNSDYYKYIRFKRANQPLSVGESFTVDYGTDDFWDMRLRPYNEAALPSSFGDPATTAFFYVEDSHGTGIKVISNGAKYPGKNDLLKLKGSSFLNGATYKLSVTYRCGSVAKASYRVAFYGSTIVTMDGAGVQTKENSFTVKDNLYLTGDHSWAFDCLQLYIDSEEAADIVVYSLTLTRTA